MPSKKRTTPRGRPMNEYTWDEMGNAERFVAVHGADVRYSPALGGWMEWDGKRWALDVAGQITARAKAVIWEMRRQLDEGEVSFEVMDDEGDLSDDARQFRNFIKMSSSRTSLNAMVELARSEPEMYAAATEFDEYQRTGRVLNVANKRITLGDDGIKVTSHRQKDLLTCLAPVEYNREAEAPEWEKFLAEKVPDEEVRDFLQKLIAYSLISQNPHRLLIILLGDTSTGKTTILEVLEGLFGEDYVTTFDMSLFRAKYDEAPRSDVVDVISKRLIYKSESNRQWELHSDVLRQMTGRDHVKARLPHKGEYAANKVPEFTPWIATNQVPTVTDAGPALWRRLVIIPFEQQHFNDDLSLVDRIVRDEGEGVLNWILEGWEAYLSDGLELPDAVVETTMAYREEMDPFDVFLRDHVELDAEYVVSDKALWETYRDWVRDGDMKRMDRRMFKDALEARGYKSDKEQKSGAKKGTRVKVWYGLRLPVVEEKQPRVHG